MWQVAHRLLVSNSYSACVWHVHYDKNLTIVTVASTAKADRRNRELWLCNYNESYMIMFLYSWYCNKSGRCACYCCNSNSNSAVIGVAMQ